MVSPLYLALVVLTLISTGLVRAYDAELGLRLRVDPLLFQQKPELLDAFIAASPNLARAFMATNILGQAVMLAWFLTCLGAFRTLHGLSRLRSGIAGTIIVALFWPFIIVVLFLSVGIFGSAAPPLH